MQTNQRQIVVALEKNDTVVAVEKTDSHVVAVGVMGPTGPTGPQGPQGVSGGANSGGVISLGSGVVSLNTCDSSVDMSLQQQFAGTYSGRF